MDALKIMCDYFEDDKQLGQYIRMLSNIPTNPYAGMGITDEVYDSLAPILNTPIRIN